MAIYQNHNPNAPIETVEFTPTIDGNLSFYHVRSADQLEAARQQLTKAGQSIITETTVDGKPMLVARGKKTDYSMIDALTEQGDILKLPETDKGFKPWKMRGWASMIGQPLQLISAYFSKAKGIDGATASFATLNIIANITNIVFGAEKSKDTYQLQKLKRDFNYQLSKYTPDGGSGILPSSVDDRLKLRATKEEFPGLGQRLYNFIKRNSVSFCEIGLRYVGSIILIFPVDNWRAGFKAFGDTLQKASPNNPDKRAGYIAAIIAGAAAAFNKRDVNTAVVGMAYVAGKSLALAAKIPDPYDPKPHTMMDTIREKVVFRLSSAIEAGAAGYLSWDRLFNRKIGFSKVAIPLSKTYEQFTGTAPKESSWLGKYSRQVQVTDKTGALVYETHPVTGQELTGSDGQKIVKMDSAHKIPDFFGGIGGALFTSGLLIRLFAKYGSKEVDVPELNAHIVDSLAIAKVPPEKLSKVIADFSAYLTDHFKGKVQFGEVYKELSDGLYRYHQISLPNTVPEIPSAHPSLQASELPPGVVKFATPDKKSSMRDIQPRGATHQERMAANDDSKLQTSIA